MSKYPIVGTLANTNTAPPPGTEHEPEEDGSAQEESRGPILLRRPPPAEPDWVLTAVGGLVFGLLLLRFGLLDVSHFLC